MYLITFHTYTERKHSREYELFPLLSLLFSELFSFFSKKSLHKCGWFTLKCVLKKLFGIICNTSQIKILFGFWKITAGILSLRSKFHGKLWFMMLEMIVFKLIIFNGLSWFHSYHSSYYVDWSARIAYFKNTSIVTHFFHNILYPYFWTKRHKCCRFEKIEKDFSISQLLPFLLSLIEMHWNWLRWD